MEQFTFSWYSVAAIVTIVGALCLFIGKMWGQAKQGFMVEKTNELPLAFFTVIKKDNVSTEIEEDSPKKRRILVSTKVFGGRPIRPKDRVKHFQGTWKQQRALELPNLGYPPLVKVEEENQEII